MAYSVVVWLVDPGKHAYQDEEVEWATAGRDHAPGAATGENVGAAFPRMVYGVYETENEAEQALGNITDTLKQNAPLRLTSQANRVFLIPANRVHYVVCSEVERPKDQR
jgi:hypothetical protein